VYVLAGDLRGDVEGERMTTAEEHRLAESDARTRHWKKWGPYLSDRAWGTVREDYSARGDAWTHLPHDHARSRAYRWNEDGLAGICDRRQKICFGIALWNGRDPILKERLFGLSGAEGNHGEDVKELYFHLDSTPTHSRMLFLYKYPQRAFPYDELVAVNRGRSRSEPEYELIDTGVFDDDRYFDVFVEYAKSDIDDLVISIRVCNRGPEDAPIDVLPTIWFRNTWSWGETSRPTLWAEESGATAIALRDDERGTYWLHCAGDPELLFTENETNGARLYGVPNVVPHVKDAFHLHVVDGDRDAVNPVKKGTKAAARYTRMVRAKGEIEILLRLSDRTLDEPFRDAHAILSARARESDEFHEHLFPASLSEDGKRVARQALAGTLWSKQWYHYVVRDWLHGDPSQPPPPRERLRGRNAEWTHLYNSDVISMPDKWEYPWYAAWDLAFHCLPIALVDPDFAKEQLVLLLREWYMHPNGQIPAYEWALSDVNPPVHAWAALRVYKIEKKRRGRGDRVFLERVFHKLMLNFTWWVNRKDAEGNNVFEGGFLGLDNIGVFDRSAPLPTGGIIEQSDATSWMAMYCLDMLSIALELAREDPAYEDVASKFWEHFVYIAHAMNTLDLWHERDGFYYDVLTLPDGRRIPLTVRSMVGLVPLFAVSTLEPELLAKLPAFRRRLEWFVDHRADLMGSAACMRTTGACGRRLLAILDAQKLARVLSTMLREDEFLSPHGIRSLSRAHRARPYVFRIDGAEHRVDYEPGESSTGLFGGNSNWRGPIWFPMNYLLVESLQKFHHYYGDRLTVEMPTGSGRWMTLDRVAAEISRRLVRIFLRDGEGRRPVFGPNEKLQHDPYFRDLVPFHEYFHADEGTGLGASHQTGWTALVVKLLLQSGE
jgi:hypothetical protein